MDYPEFDGTQNCFGLDTEEFYIDDRRKGSVWVNATLLEEAKKLCESCSFLEKCRTYALKREKYGVWGGTSPRERDKMRKELGISLESYEHSNAMRKLLYKREGDEEE